MTIFEWALIVAVALFIGANLFAFATLWLTIKAHYDDE